MDTREYENSPVARAARSWAWFMTGTIDFQAAIYESLNMLGPGAALKGLASKISKNVTHVEQLRWHNTVTRAANERATGFTNVNRHILVDAWGGFESFVEDFCRSAVISDKSLLNSDELRMLSLDPSFGTRSEEDRAAEVLRKAFNRANRPRKVVGFDKIRTQLKHVGLSIKGTPELEKRAAYAQQLRHLIVHKRSIADETFVARCPEHAHALGDQVALDTTALGELLGSLVVYGLLIVNTDRKRKGLEPFPWPIVTSDAELEAPYKQEWGHIHPETGWWEEPGPLFYQLYL